MAPSSAHSSTRSRGRPVEIDKGQVARVALDLFEARGYEAVSAAEIAEASGISRRSLFRYFPTKADLVWDRFADSVDVLTASLSAAAEEDPVKAVMSAMARVADATPILDITRARLRIIARTPTLVAFGMSRLSEQADISTHYLAERGLDPLRALVIGNAVTATTFSGYLHWALTSGDESPAETVRQALAALAGIGG
ncbi:TetR/AcrR family transcriptional regulator [Nocardioides sp.]|uniref:TetR/AcrR family transcriptional regulator n=1 Tax=Nocardioides sp. TaxID=35761 RepID=UPI0039E56776